MQKATFAWLNKLAEGKQSALSSDGGSIGGSVNEGGTSDEDNPME